MHTYTSYEGDDFYIREHDETQRKDETEEHHENVIGEVDWRR